MLLAQDSEQFVYVIFVVGFCPAMPDCVISLVIYDSLGTLDDVGDSIFWFGGALNGVENSVRCIPPIVVVIYLQRIIELLGIFMCLFETGSDSIR